MESILDSVKTMLGIELDDTSFDGELMLHINSIFLIFNQLGLGPSKAFSISDNSDTWSDFFGENDVIEAAKTDMFLRVKLLFDSATMSSGLIEQYNKEIAELEWRMNIEVDPSLVESS